jgi:predicted dehydrogenase
MKSSASANNTSNTRREFLKRSTATLAATAALGYARQVHAAGDDVLRIGLIGCGGRGSGAAGQALKADKNVKLVALGDAFGDRLESSLANLKEDNEIAGRIDVPAERRFVGFDAYRQVIDAGVDVVLLATPPHFRPLHLAAAVEAGKHVFAEKPVAVDAPGIRAVLASCEVAKRKNLSVCSGLCLRYSFGFKEAVQRIHDGQIGEVLALEANDLRGPIWIKPRQSDWDDMTWQMRNWYYFTWLSGDFNVEQHVHFLDICAWVMQERYPATAVGCGGRQVRTGPEYGNIFDHHSVVYQYADGPRMFSHCRQQAGCHSDMSVQVLGTKGDAHLSEQKITIRAHGSSEPAWRFRGQDNDIYQTEHDDLFVSIRAGKPINHGAYMARSTLLAILGRMATYTGQLLTWDQALDSQEDLSPASYRWGPIPTPAIAVPGITRFV